MIAFDSILLELPASVGIQVSETLGHEEGRLEIFARRKRDALRPIEQEARRDFHQPHRII